MSDQRVESKALLKRLRDKGLLTEQEYEAELADLAVQDAQSVQLGSGTIAQEGGKAAGERGVAADQIQGHVATGDNSQFVQTETYIENQQILADPSKIDPVYLRQAYLSYLYTQVRALSLLGVDRDAASNEAEARVHLDAVYTALLTQQPQARAEKGARHLAQLAQMVPEHQQRHASAVEQLNRYTYLVLLGDPGSGKSTFVNFVALCLAGQALQRPQVNLALLTAPLPITEEGQEDEREPEPQPWIHGTLLPVRIILRDLAASHLPPTHQAATLNHLWHYIKTQLQGAGLLDYIDFLRKELLEQGGLILFDGLDEVPEAADRRVQIKQIVEDFAATFPRCRIVVTSRPYAYQDPAWQLDGFTATLLAPFSDAQIRLFVDRWYGHSAEQQRVNAEDAQGRSELLKHAIFASDRLHELAQRPLLLTLMASLHAWHGGNLPERREELYASAVDLLLDRWERRRIVQNADGEQVVIQPSLAEYLKVDREELRAVLNSLAFQVHASQPDMVDVADIAETDLVNALLEISRNAEANPVLLIEYLSQRAGLLLPRGPGIYSLPHRSFQEYLVACHLTEDDYPDQLARLARLQPDRWREPALLAGAKAASGTPAAIWLLVDALCYRHPSDSSYDLKDHWGALIAGQTLSGTIKPARANERIQKKLDVVRNSLLAVMGKSQLPAYERAQAGRTLARLDDPRTEVMSVEQMHFCHVPGGPFEMGEDNELHTISHLDYDYWMARYPVTNAQFQQFMEAEGYTQKQYWEEAIEANRWKDGQIKRSVVQEAEGNFKIVDEWDTSPYDYGSPFNFPNHPVVGISWYETLAFTRWLTDHFHQADLLPDDWSITLPSEAEWEKAARGGHQVPVEPLLATPMDNRWVAQLPPELQSNPNQTRLYPWQADRIDSEWANYGDPDITSTTAVGCYPSGISPYGIEEQAGNVFEWTRTVYGFDSRYAPDDGREQLDANDSELRVLRGGVWGGEEEWARCGARRGNHPDLGYFNGGFRVSASPSTSGS